MDHEYDALDPIDDHHESGSNTEVDESLMGDEKPWKHQHNRSHQSLRSRISSLLTKYRWTIDTALLTTILILLLRNQKPQPQPPRYDFGGDFTGVAPRFSQQIVKFNMDPSYAPTNTSEFFTDAVLSKWNNLMPKGMGFVWVNDTHKYHDLPTPIEWPDKTVFTTSMTHQLHCLFAIVQTYSGLKANHPIPDDHHWHMIHCFDYMRQAIMCSADMALEGHETTFPDDNGGSDGWDSKHVCKDYSQVIGYLESVRAYDDQLIY
ncbi:hypothetical protein QBC34DRAFT_306324 [Podospora aff. communis PSN243]|uniref:Oxidase ustYa n=1 Tax=Podospora aff. communis PSN243 TaxID=3040156 RepID=A0AAV9GAH3_9PEZI|nr:hypothetical protein QBC34DRAFT_306324 [Podospora aff. communis PSN243]